MESKVSQESLPSPSSTPWSLIPKLDPPHRDVIPSRTAVLLVMLGAAKQAAGACPATSGASLPSGQL